MSACDAVPELLVAHALGALEASEDALVREHLAACEPCRAAEARARADVAAIDAPPVAPPPAVWARIRARVAASRAGDEPVRGPDPSDSQAVIALSCSFCRGGLVRADAVYCASCLAPHHPECWREYGRCSVMGCGEQRVVRPSERPDVAPAPVTVPGGDKTERLDALGRRRRRRRWAGGGLVVALAGGLAAAALAPTSRLDAPTRVVAAPAPVPVPAPAPPEPRWDVTVRDASLGELCAALEREAGARIDLSAGLTDLLLREGRWRAVTWRELLREVAREHHLVLREEQDRLALGGDIGAAERATASLERRTTQRLELAPRWRLRELRSGPPHQVAVAPAADAVALVEGRSVRLITRERDATLTFEAPFERARWSDDGVAVALWGRAGLALVDLAGGPPELVLRRGDSPAHVAWAPMTNAAPLTTSDSGEVSDAVLQQERTAYRRLVEPLSSDAFLEVAFVGGGARFTRLERPPRGAAEAVTSPSVLPGWPRRAWTFDVPVARPAFDLSLDRSRLLVTGEDVRLYDTATGQQLGPTIPRRARSTLRADLSPDGRRIAWIDGGLLFVRQVDDAGGPAAADAQVLAAGSAHAAAGCAWRGDGGALALWSSGGEVATIDVGALDRGGTLDAAVQLTLAVDGASWAGEARWAGDALVVTSTRSSPRQPRVVVAPAGTARPDVVVDVDWITPDGAPPAPPPPAPATEAPPAPTPTGPSAPPTPSAPTGPTEAPAETTSEAPPTPPRAVPDPPPPVDEPAPAAPIPRALSHVRPGQRYTFRGHQGEVRTWEVLEVTADGVVYREVVTLHGAEIGDPRRETWRLRRPEQVVRAGEPRRARWEVGGARFDCLVLQIGDTTRWVAVAEGGLMAFPGEVRWERGGTVMLELTAVE